MTESNHVFRSQVAYQLIFSHRATADSFNRAVKPFAALLIGGWAQRPHIDGKAPACEAGADTERVPAVAGRRLLGAAT